MRRAAAAICAALLTSACSAPPQREIERAQGAIEAARAAGAEQYALEPFTAATTAMQQTHDAVQQRDYRLALSRATDANERALEAARQAANGKARARSDAEAAIVRTTTMLRSFDERLKTAESSRVSDAELNLARKFRADTDHRLQEARKTLIAGDYLAAIAVLGGVPERLTEEIRVVGEAIDVKTGKAGRRRR